MVNAINDPIGSYDDLPNEIIAKLWNNAAKLWKLGEQLCA